MVRASKRFSANSPMFRIPSINCDNCEQETSAVDCVLGFLMAPLDAKSVVTISIVYSALQSCPICRIPHDFSEPLRFSGILCNGSKCTSVICISSFIARMLLFMIISH